MYKGMALSSSLIRMFILPNPFGEMDFGFFINIIVGEPLFHILAFTIVGIVYKRGDAPALGSFMYLMAYWGLIVVTQGIVI
ncbi:MAG: hypothetical protein KKH92_08120 [Firmicutes bacterium]|nr:hypothetical protein [Bacillota bacterium]